MVNEKESGRGQRGRAGSRGRGERQSTGRPDRQTGRELPAASYLDVCQCADREKETVRQTDRQTQRETVCVQNH